MQRETPRDRRRQHTPGAAEVPRSILGAPWTAWHVAHLRSSKLSRPEKGCGWLLSCYNIHFGAVFLMFSEKHAVSMIHQGFGMAFGWTTLPRQRSPAMMRTMRKAEKTSEFWPPLCFLFTSSCCMLIMNGCVFCCFSWPGALSVCTDANAGNGQGQGD